MSRIRKIYFGICDFFKSKSETEQEKKDLCLIIKKLLHVIEDNRVSKQEITELRRIAYEILLRYDMDK